VLPDTDADGLPDPWEMDSGICLTNTNHGLADDDGDGLTNLQEYQAGTDPTNALSYLKVESFVLADGGRKAVLRFLAVSNRTYTVRSCEAMPGGRWQRLMDVVATSTNQFVEVRDPGAPGGSQRYYRLVTPRVP
jgi:hypothetical protein